MSNCTVNGIAVACPEWLGPATAFVFVAAALFCAFAIATGWKIFTKAGKPGWASLIPVYSSVVLIEIVRKPVWWVILTLIPFANIIVGVILAHELAKAFGKGIGFTVGLIILPFVFAPILAFGKAQYLWKDVPVPPQL